ncbi:short-subunit dehydrogenase [Nocardioides thalensis]|uniref:Short-subunit dehydrogenase n=1 Tax=Nocardioides thalensis TaxID=1914755 RepID=A0A853C1L3_9ACTN|nr:SDR family NAD(P)-dependent oxidoreductase [Nocardioides thalensis]NYJ00243.1 short-subunit dehydrogenase [Nocardioides thalensis]
MLVVGKVWVVTGAGSGMGRELVRELIARGGRVAAVDRSEAGLAGTAELVDTTRLTTHVVDITDRDAVAALPDEVEAAHGAIDGLINNAGIIQPFVPVIDLADDDIERVMEINFNGTLRMSRAFLPRLIGRPEAHLVNVSSMGGFFPFPGQSIYGASKAAVKLLSEGLYAELLDTGVRVSVVFPGAINTQITANSGVDQPVASEDDAKVPMTSPEKAARIIVDGIQRDRLHIHVGRDAQLMSLAIKVAPRAAIRLVKRAMAKRLAPEAV